MTDQQRAPLAFGDVVIDFAGRRVMRGGEPQPLEPKAFEVLAMLARAPGQAFDRDTLLDAVWGHRHVTPGVLNRVMSLLRHALGEDAHHPRYLHTLHGIGYRFDLPAMAGAPPAGPLGQSHPQVDEQGQESGRDPTPRIAAIAAGDAPEPPRERRVGDAAATPAMGRARMYWALAACLAAAVGLATWQGWPARTPAPRVGNDAPPPTLVVLPLRPIGAAAADRELAAGLSDALISALSRIEGLHVIARESTSLATSAPAGIETLVPRLGITHALAGSVRQSGENLRIHLRLTEAASGRAVWVQDFDRDASAMLALEREVAQAVASALTLKLGLAFGSAGKGGNADYYRRYLAARRSLFARPVTRSAGIQQVETQFRALLELRPDDARAHAGLALALEMRAFREPALATRLRAEAAREAAVARRLDATLADPYRVQAAGACRASDWERCLALYRKAIALSPSESAPRFQYAMALAALGYLDQAEAAMRSGVKSDPLNAGWRFGYGRILDTRGRHDEARVQLDLSDNSGHYGRWFNAVWRRDYANARRHADAIGSEDAGTPDPYAQLLRTSYLLATEALLDPRRWPQAQAAMRTSEERMGLMNFLSVLQPQRDVPRLINDLDVVRQRSYSSWDLLLWTRDLAYLRRDPAFQDYLRRNGILDYWKRHGFPEQCRAAGAGAVCQ